jgi:DNA modification methylase
MPVELAKLLIEHLTVPGGVVLDPMGGSGTTAVAARRLGRIGLVFDLDPLAVILGRVASATLDLEIARRAHDRVLAHATAAAKKSASRSGANARAEEKEFLDYWFPKRSQRELFALAEAIRGVRDPSIAEFLWVVFSSLVVAKSAGASYALDLAHTRPHRDLDKEIVWPLESWNARFERLASGLAFQDPGDRRPASRVWLGDARTMAVRSGTIDLIVTSPPYMRSNREAIDYLRAHKFSLVWMGHDLTKLRQLRAAAIGTVRGLYSADGLPAPVESDLLRRILLPSRSAKLRRYLSDLHAVLKETHRVLRPGAVAVFALGPSVISLRRHDAAEVFQCLAESVGLGLVAAATRRLSERSRSLPPPRLVGSKNSLRKRMRSETLVALRKPVVS